MSNRKKRIESVLATAIYCASNQGNVLNKDQQNVISMILQKLNESKIVQMKWIIN